MTEKDAGMGHVFFADQHKLVDGTDPPVTAVPRRFPASAAAGAAMAELFNGPAPEERDRELLFVPSHATGFADLRVTDRVAHVRLLGPITSGGSTITIADQILPTLKQFPTVEWVKIYDEDGKTRHPDGSVDSIPYQLEP
jgi:hypothetical protein